MKENEGKNAIGCVGIIFIVSLALIFLSDCVRDDDEYIRSDSEVAQSYFEQVLEEDKNDSDDGAEFYFK